MIDFYTIVATFVIGMIVSGIFSIGNLKDIKDESWEIILFRIICLVYCAMCIVSFYKFLLIINHKI